MLQDVHTAIEPYSITTSRAVHLNLSSIWSKALSRVFGGDTALEGKAACGDVVLSQAELLERCTGCDLDLCGYDIDAGDFFGDSVLDLTAIMLDMVLKKG
jgi:hypothetical protein